MSGAAMVHDYFVQDGGAELVAIELARLLPGATIHTTFFDPQASDRDWIPSRVHSWRLNMALRRRDSARFCRSIRPTSRHSTCAMRLCLSNSSAFAKAARTRQAGTSRRVHPRADALCVAVRDVRQRVSLSLPARVAGRLLGAPLRSWDRRTSQRPDVLVANSQNIRRPISRFWGRDSEVIHPPVDVAEFDVPTRNDGYLLVAARLLAYRRVDIAVDAATSTGRELVVVGDGPERARSRLAPAPTSASRAWSRAHASSSS